VCLGLVILPSTIKSRRSFVLALAHPGVNEWSRKKSRKTVVGISGETGLAVCLIGSFSVTQSLEETDIVGTYRPYRHHMTQPTASKQRRKATFNDRRM